MKNEFRLSTPGSGQGVSCDTNGAFVGCVPLLKRCKMHGLERWEGPECEHLSKQIGSDFALPIDLSSKMGGLKAIANALNAGDIARAQVAAVLLAIPDRPPLAKGARSRDAMIQYIRDLHWSGLIKADWNSEDHPRWPANAPDGQGGQFAPETDSDECGRYETARRRWMRHYGRDWPRDAAGRRYDLHHIKARADDGTDDPENIKPMPHDEHVREHKEKGDFKRWAQRRWSGRTKSNLNVDEAPTSGPKVKAGTAPAASPKSDRPSSRTPVPSRAPQVKPSARPETAPQLGSGPRPGSPKVAPKPTSQPLLGPEEPITPEQMPLEDPLPIEDVPFFFPE